MRPHVIVNVAMSADGKISTRERRQVRISGSQDFTRVDRLKSGCDAIMVGIGTVLADDPSLTVKSEECREYRRKHGWDENPLRIVVDSSGRTPPDSSVLNKGDGKRVVALSKKADPDTISVLNKKATIIIAGEDEVDLPLLMDNLGAMGICRILVEGGGTLIAGLINAGLVNEIYTFIGNIIIGGKDAPTLSDGEGCIKESSFTRLTLLDARRIEQGILLHWIVSES
ncbi:MAG: 2,5-diamino-6-(ribosylamino)-4(3H)-pyrimidinone 5'-phosphate reductase [Methanoregula sp.]|jgi:2,5-diamino-6-(ribosylamino)-4(3H)-pyrimidinone 5'-phosphate reductase